MYNKSHQLSRLKASKRLVRDNSCCMQIFECIFKRCIHVFILIFLVSLVAMFVTILNYNEDAIYDEEMHEDIRWKEWFIRNNPVAYGLKAAYGDELAGGGIDFFAQ